MVEKIDGGRTMNIEILEISNVLTGKLYIGKGSLRAINLEYNRIEVSLLYLI